MKKYLLTLIFGFIFILLIVGVYAEVCTVVPRGSCTGSSVPIMGLSSANNAHAQVWNASSYGYTNYSHVLCCDYSGDFTCTGTNTVVSLSSVSNAHAELASGSNYNIDVCYEGLSCVGGSACNSTYPMQVLSLTSTTNAHLGNFSDYSTKVCCSYTPSLFCGDGICSSSIGETTNSCPSDCFGSLFWSNNPSSGTISSANVSDTVYLRAVNTGLSQGSQVAFQVFEDDPLSDDDIRTPALNNTILATVGVNGSVSASMQITSNDWNEGFDGPTEGSEEEFFFTLNSYTSPTLLVYNEQTVIQDCSEYMNQTECNNYAQSVADNTVNNIEGSGFAGCGNTVPVEGSCFATINCRCIWSSNSSTCGSSYSEVNDPVTCQGDEPTVEGSCVYTGSTQDSCDDGLISYTVDAEWVWTGTGLTQSEYDALSVGEQADYVQSGSIYYYDPKGLSLSCSSSQRTIPCPAQIQVPFFGAIQLALAIISILAVYLIFFMVRKDNE